MSQKSCSICYYFEERTGFCRRNPPTVVLGRNLNHSGEDVIFSTTLWPKPDQNTRDWCGEFERYAGG